MPTPLDELRQLADGTLPPPPVATLIGFTLSAVSPGEAVIELAAGRQHANPMGALHGGVLCDIADAAMGMAYASTLDEGETFATVELKRAPAPSRRPDCMTWWLPPARASNA